MGAGLRDRLLGGVEVVAVLLPGCRASTTPWACCMICGVRNIHCLMPSPDSITRHTNSTRHTSPPVAPGKASGRVASPAARPSAFLATSLSSRRKPRYFHPRPNPRSATRPSPYTACSPSLRWRSNPPLLPFLWPPAGGGNAAPSLRESPPIRAGPASSRR